jgi:phage recombination protein Bet
MNQVSPAHHVTAAQLWSGRQLDVMRRTMCADATDAEFEQFIQYAVAKRLDPFVGQVILVVYSKDNPKKRKSTIITTQAGCRVLAQRCGSYRPATDEPNFTYDDGLKGPANPLGLVKCTTTLFIQDNKSDWYPVNGVAYWDEYAPIKEMWADDQESGRRKPTGKKTVEGNWAKMGRTMLAKCATMRALAAGWPDTFSGVYSEEEIDRDKALDLDAVQLIEADRVERRKVQVAMRDNDVAFVDEGGVLVFLPAGQFADNMLRLASAYKTRKQIESLRIRNREGLKRHWALHKHEALQLKAELEKIEAKLPVEQPVEILGA